MFTWHEAKRHTNLRKHGIDFKDASAIFDGFTVTSEDTRKAYGEQRLLTLGALHGIVVSITHTERDEQLHIISIRKATRHEERFYFSQIPDRP